MRSTKLMNPVSLPKLPNEIILEIFNHIPSKQLTKFMILSHSMNIEIRKLLIKRYNEIFWNPHRRILVMITRYILDFVPIYNVFDLGFKRLDNNSLLATFQLDSTQKPGTIGPLNKKFWGLKLRGDGILRDNLLNEPIFYTSWDIPHEKKEARIYVYDSETDPSHPFIKTFFVTCGMVEIPCDVREETNGYWFWNIFNNIRGKNASIVPKIGFLGKNEKKSNSNDVFGMLKSVCIQAPMLLAAIEEQKKDRYVNGIKYLVMDGGQQFLKRKRGCVIS